MSQKVGILQVQCAYKDQMNCKRIFINRFWCDRCYSQLLFKYTSHITDRRYKTLKIYFKRTLTNVNLEPFIIKIDSMIRTVKKKNEKVLINSKAFVDHRPALQRNSL